MRKSHHIYTAENSKERNRSKTNYVNQLEHYTDQNKPYESLIMDASDKKTTEEILKI